MRTSLFALLVLSIAIAQSGSGAAQGGAPQGTGDLSNGKAVFAFGNTSCTNCHGLEAQGGWGPDLAGRKITYDQAKHFAQAFLRGQPHKASTVAAIAGDKIRQLRS